MSEGVGVVVCGAVAALLFGAALRDMVVVRRLRRDGVRTRGMVIDNVRGDDGDGPKWVPVIAFADHKGYRVEFSPKMTGTGMGLETGRAVDVVYPAHAPQNARVFTSRHMAGPAWFMLLGGVERVPAGTLRAPRVVPSAVDFAPHLHDSTVGRATMAMTTRHLRRETDRALRTVVGEPGQVLRRRHPPTVGDVQQQRGGRTPMSPSPIRATTCGTRTRTPRQAPIPRPLPVPTVPIQPFATTQPIAASYGEQGTLLFLPEVIEREHPTNRIP
jgi:hypothetical protein